MHSIPSYIYGILLAMLVAVVIVGGIKRIGETTEKIVPTMVVFENGVLVKRWNGHLQKGLTLNQIELVNDYLTNS